MLLVLLFVVVDWLISLIAHLTNEIYYFSLMYVFV